MVTKAKSKGDHLMKILSRILLVLAVLMLCFGLLVCVAIQTENAQQTAGVYIDRPSAALAVPPPFPARPFQKPESALRNKAFQGKAPPACSAHAGKV